jgi:hypothetical protein
MLNQAMPDFWKNKRKSLGSIPSFGECHPVPQNNLTLLKIVERPFFTQEFSQNRIADTQILFHP